jgi:glucose-6-phosphate 1-dehydrogenase
MPAFYHLDAADKLPEGTTILAVGRTVSGIRKKWIDEVKEMIQNKVKTEFDEKVFRVVLQPVSFIFYAGIYKHPNATAVLATELAHP